MSTQPHKTLIADSLVGFSFTGEIKKLACIVQFSGQEIGRPYFLPQGDTIIGREPRSGVRLSEPRVSRFHALIKVSRKQISLEDLGSANGTFLNGKRIKSVRDLRDGDTIAIGPARFKYFEPGNVDQLFYDELYKKATIDEKTGVFNDKFLLGALNSEVDVSLSFGRDMSIVIYDLDHFKKVNDRFGHAFGDHVLSITAQIVSRSIRHNDMLCRYGGEEFVVILPETDVATAHKLAERFTQAVASFKFTFKGPKETIEYFQTLSAGVAQLNTDCLTSEKLMQHADAKLYKAKKEGRNRVCS